MRLVLTALLLMTSGAMAENLPVPPIPPSSVPADQPAPMPNHDTPRPLEATNTSPTVNFRMFRQTSFDHSDGFTPGSRFQDTEDRRLIATPGLSVTVPLK